MLLTFYTVIISKSIVFVHDACVSVVMLSVSASQLYFTQYGSGLLPTQLEN
jgi:hypothetical protein